MEKLIAVIPKNQHEEVRVALAEFEKDRTTDDMVSTRVHYDAGAREINPGRNSFNILVRLLPELVAALTEAEADARAAGLIEDTAPTEPSHADGAEYGAG